MAGFKAFRNDNFGQNSRILGHWAAKTVANGAEILHGSSLLLGGTSRKDFRAIGLLVEEHQQRQGCPKRPYLVLKGDG